MRKKNFKGRCEKRKIGKCAEVCRTYDAIQYAYADLLQASDHCDGYTEKYLSGGTVTVAYNPEDVTSVWVLENGTYTEFDVIESRFEGKDLTTVQELQDSQKSITRSASRDNLQAQINLANHIETIADGNGGHTDVHMKNIRSTRKREQDKRHKDYMKEGTSSE